MTLFLRARHRLTDSRLRFDPCAGSCFGLDRTGERMLGVAQAHADKKIARSCAHAHSYTMNLMKSFLIAPSPKCAPAIASRARSRRKGGQRYGLRLATILLPNWDEGQRADTTTGPRMRFRPENIDQTARDRIRLGGMAKPVWAIHARSRVQGTILS